MYISHSKKFIFVHVQKTGGTSIKKVLFPHLYHLTVYNRILSYLNIYPKVFFEDYDQHISACRIKQILPRDIFNSYFKFGFVRNPWDWMVSWYSFIRKWQGHEDHQLVMQMEFSDFLEWRLNKGFYTQVGLICDQEGNSLVDFVGRFERLQDDFQVICKRLELETGALPLTNKSNHVHYQDYYDAGSRKLIEQYFQKDIQLFSYKFN